MPEVTVHGGRNNSAKKISYKENYSVDSFITALEDNGVIEKTDKVVVIDRKSKRVLIDDAKKTNELLGNIFKNVTDVDIYFHYY